MPDDSEISLVTVNGEHVCVTAIITPGAGERYGTVRIEVRGVVVSSSVREFVGRRFVYYCEVNSSNEPTLREFLNASHNGGEGNMSSLCLALEEWCKVEGQFRRFAFGANVRFSKVTFFKIEGQREAEVIGSTRAAARVEPPSRRLDQNGLPLEDSKNVEADFLADRPTRSLFMDDDEEKK